MLERMHGGSFENNSSDRSSKQQSEWPINLPLFVRISATDWADGGWNAEESVQLSILLKEKELI
jgi:2,4-dienoyl-CoA reductase-like NADH-dependent reductase (Old Yellow Enzyme family)